MNRFDTFLYKNLKKYNKINLIDEIVISDENGEDIRKIKNSDLDLTKIKMFQNETRLGPFLNKIECCKHAMNEWIVLMDSDNLAPPNYFETAKNYIESNSLSGLYILSPSWAQPNFDYRKLEGMIYKRGDFLKNRIEERKRKTKCIECCMNTGNYVINKNIFEKLNLKGEEKNIKMSSACDVIYFNTLVFEQTDTQFHIVKDLYYEHVVHKGSIYNQTHTQYPRFNNQVHNRYRNLK